MRDPLMKAINDMVNMKRVVEDTDLYKEFSFTESIQEIVDIKVAAIKLDEAGKLTMMNNAMGGFVLISNNNTFH